MSTATAPATFTNSTPLLEEGDFEALRARATEEGYLFFRQLLPKEDLRELRLALLGVVDRFGWLDPDAPLEDGVVDVGALNRVPREAMRLDIGVSAEAYDAVQHLEVMHRMPHHPRLLELYRGLFDRDVLVHPRHIVRMVTPHRDMVPTPQHQDFPLIQGSANTWTCWFPVGDCPRELGGLTVLSKSHRKGYLPIQPAEGAGEMASQLCPGEDAWVEGDYTMGDILTFPSLTVHKALKCRLPNRIRLSLDVRYQPADEIVEYKSLLPHCELSWDQIYGGWQREDLQYYWRRMPLKLSPWDDTLRQPRQRIC